MSTSNSIFWLQAKFPEHVIEASILLLTSHAHNLVTKKIKVAKAVI